MKPQDARSLSPDALFDLRTRVVAAVRGGMTQVEAARVFAVHRSAVNRWCRAADPDALRPRPALVLTGAEAGGRRWPLATGQDVVEQVVLAALDDLEAHAVVQGLAFGQFAGARPSY